VVVDTHSTAQWSRKMDLAVEFGPMGLTETRYRIEEDVLRKHQGDSGEEERMPEENVAVADIVVLVDQNTLVLQANQLYVVEVKPAGSEYSRQGRPWRVLTVSRTALRNCYYC